MNIPVTLTDGQQVALGVEIFDQAKPTANKYESTADYPEGFTTVWESSDPSIAEVVVRPDGLNVDVYTPKAGSATVTVTTTGLPADVFALTITRSVPGKQNATVGAITDEASA